MAMKPTAMMAPVMVVIAFVVAHLDRIFTSESLRNDWTCVSIWVCLWMSCSFCWCVGAFFESGVCASDCKGGAVSVFVCFASLFLRVFRTWLSSSFFAFARRFLRSLNFSFCCWRSACSGGCSTGVTSSILICLCWCARSCSSVRMISRSCLCMWLSLMTWSCNCFSLASW